MTELAEKLRQKYFGHLEHPYRIFEREVERYVHPESTLLDAGCGRTAPVLEKYRNKAKRLIGVDLVEFETTANGLELINGDLCKINLPSGCVDVVMSRSVMEHVEDPLSVYHEINRILKPGGRFIFLTANLWDYASLVAKVIPNRFHPWIVSKVEGRKEHDVFPVRYRTNTFGSVRRLAEKSGFKVASFRYLGQYPSYFMFNGGLFFLATGYEKLISRFDSLAFLRGWVLVILNKK